MKEINKSIIEPLKQGITVAHCISSDCVMGAGVAVVINEAMPGMRRMLRDALKVKPITKVPDIIGVRIGDKTVINLITKINYFDKPTYPVLYKSIELLKDYCVKHNHTEIAIPKIGCNLDGKSWKKVSSYIDSIFKDSGVTVTNYYV